MTTSSPNAAAEGANGSGTELPAWLDSYATLGLYGLAVGTVLALFALWTNPVPDPSFPWATLPGSWRLPFRQPRIEHWPVTYTLGIWLWTFCFPAIFLKGEDAWGERRPGGSALRLVWLPVLAMFGWTAYCRFGWPKPDPATWNAPSYTFVCWLYCSTYAPVWSNLAFGIATVGLATGILLREKIPGARLVLIAFGALSLPLGLPALEAARRLGERPEPTS